MSKQKGKGNNTAQVTPVQSTPVQVAPVDAQVQMQQTTPTPVNLNSVNMFGGPSKPNVVAGKEMLLSDDIVFPSSTAIVPIASVVNNIVRLTEGKYKITVHPVNLNEVSNIVRQQNLKQLKENNNQQLVYSITGGGGATLVPVLNIPISTLERKVTPSTSLGDKIFQSKNEGIDANKFYHQFKNKLFGDEGFVPVVNTGEGIVYYYVNIVRLILTSMGLPLKDTLNRYKITIGTDVNESNYQVTLTDRRYVEYR